MVVRPRDGFDQIRWTADNRKVLIKVLPDGMSVKEANEVITSAENPLSAEKKQPGSTVRIYRALVSPRSGSSDTDGDTAIHQDPFTKALRADLAFIDVKDEKLERIARGYNPLWYRIKYFRCWPRPAGFKVTICDLKESVSFLVSTQSRNRSN